ncbi:MAG: hypothetical protein LBQ54_00935 [Planctomycetaceae bacterium]|jgi:hypothetical protein|nr:hypothetical protein [Planctomycetaceae bacterium]
MTKRTFTDNEGRHWSPKINLYTASRIKRNLDVNIEDFNALNAAITDPCSRCDLLFLSIEDQAIKNGVTPESFGRSLAGDVMKEATEALLNVISDFFEDAKKRTAFTEMVQAMREEAEKTTDYMITQSAKIKAAISRAGESFRKEFQKNLDTLANPDPPETKSKTSGKTSGKTRESSE